MSDLDSLPRRTRKRGGQPGNLNAFKDGRYSRRLAASFRIVPPGDVREHLLAVVAAVVRLELGRLGPRPTSEERAVAVGRAIRRVQRAMSSRNYREARSPLEVFRWFHEAIDSALTAAPEPLEAASPGTTKRPENE